MEVELQPSYKACNCDQVRRRAVACLLWDMQLGPMSLDAAPFDNKLGTCPPPRVGTRKQEAAPPANKKNGSRVATQLEDMQLRAWCGACNWAPHVSRRHAHRQDKSPLVATKLEDMQLRAWCGTCNWAPCLLTPPHSIKNWVPAPLPELGPEN